MGVKLSKTIKSRFNSGKYCDGVDFFNFAVACNLEILFEAQYFPLTFSEKGKSFTKVTKKNKINSHGILLKNALLS